MLFEIIYIVLGILLVILFAVTLVDMILIGFPILKYATKLEKEKFLITKSNYFERQGKVECSAFASAYVYRHLGKHVTGQQLYLEMPNKAPNGYVFCRGIVSLAHKYGLYAKFHIGNLTALKNTVAKGVPVIVMIHSHIHSNNLHYITVVGYDDENIYAVDSAMNSNKNEHFNRIISIKDFKKLWNTSLLRHPLYFNLFFEISMK